MKPIKQIVLIALAIGTGSALFGCDYLDTGDRKIDPIEVNHALSVMNSCDDYLAYTKETAIHKMRTEVELNCQSMLDDVSRMNGGWFGADSDADADFDMSGGGDENGDGDFSQTNNQEEGVDEADILKTDGDFIYVLSGEELVVVSVESSGALTEQGRLTLFGMPQEMFLYGDLAVVFGGLETSEIPEEIELPDPNQTGGYGYYDYYNWFQNWYTAVHIVDLSDRTAPVLLKTTSYAGRYVSSRRVANALRGVLSTPMPTIEFRSWPNVEYWNMTRLKAKHAINTACDALIEENIEAINEITLDEILPKKMADADTAASPMAPCENIYGPETPAGNGLLTILSIDLDNPLGEQENVGVVGEEGLVYASEDAIYLTTARNYAWNAWWSGLWMDETSGIHKFDIESDAKTASYVASGTVTGRMLDQFCLGEYGGHLRVATTTGSAWWEDNTLDNHITIFRHNGDVLEAVSHLDGIGKGEEIYASRFMGDRGFLVTFLQTDPLFTFDLSDPEDPKVVGEWLGPGYSTYLHPYGENLLIAMGVDGNWRTVVSLYDIEDFAEPTLVERQELPGADYQSAALHEHKAFTFNPGTGELLLPFHAYGSNGLDTGVLLYDVTAKGISLTGTLEMGGNPDMEGPARRSMYNAKNLVGVSTCRITSAPLSDPSATISSIPIWEDACNFPGWWGYEW